MIHSRFFRVGVLKSMGVALYKSSISIHFNDEKMMCSMIFYHRAIGISHWTCRSKLRVASRDSASMGWTKMRWWQPETSHRPHGGDAMKGTRAGIIELHVSWKIQLLAGCLFIFWIVLVGKRHWQLLKAYWDIAIVKGVPSLIRSLEVWIPGPH
jgi:hypothetical protein